MISINKKGWCTKLTIENFIGILSCYNKNLPIVSNDIFGYKCEINMDKDIRVRNIRYLDGSNNEAEGECLVIEPKTVIMAKDR